MHDIFLRGRKQIKLDLVNQKIMVTHVARIAMSIFRRIHRYRLSVALPQNRFDEWLPIIPR